MLQGEYGGRHQHRHLLAVGNGLECGADGDFRLSETYVAAHQAVHRAVILHIAFNGDGGRFLVGGILEHKGGLELVLQVGIRRKSEALGGAALGVELDEVLGNVLDLALSVGLEGGPGLGTELVYAGRLPFRRTEEGQFVQGVHRHEYHVPVLVGYLHYLPNPSLLVEHTHEAAEHAHSVVDMHYIVPYVERIQVVDGELLALLDAAPDVHAVETVEDFVVGVDGNLAILVHEAVVYVLPLHEFGQHPSFAGDDGLYPVQLGGLFAVDVHLVSVFLLPAYILLQQLEIFVEAGLGGDVVSFRILHLHPHWNLEEYPAESGGGGVEIRVLVEIGGIQPESASGREDGEQGASLGILFRKFSAGDFDTVDALL